MEARFPAGIEQGDLQREIMLIGMTFEAVYGQQGGCQQTKAVTNVAEM